MMFRPAEKALLALTARHWSWHPRKLTVWGKKFAAPWQFPVYNYRSEGFNINTNVSLFICHHHDINLMSLSSPGCSLWLCSSVSPRFVSDDFWTYMSNFCWRERRLKSQFAQDLESTWKKRSSEWSEKEEMLRYLTVHTVVFLLNLNESAWKESNLFYCNLLLGEYIWETVFRCTKRLPASQIWF